MSALLRHPAPPDAAGQVHAISPASAGWAHVGFDLFDLPPGRSLERDTGEREACLVLVSGRAAVAAAGADFGTIGERDDPFAGRPWSLYVPPHMRLAGRGAGRLRTRGMQRAGPGPAARTADPGPPR